MPNELETNLADEVLVRSYGALPGSGLDASQAILAAISYAQTQGIHRVRFEAGVYQFKGLPGWERTEKLEHAGYMLLQGLADIELVGAVDELGKPATLWVKDNDLKECQPAILSIEHGANVTLRNITVDMAPYYSSAGRVVAVQDDEVTIEMLPGHPRIDGQPAYIMGLYDLEARKAKVVRLTWDFDLPQWHTSGDENDHRMAIHHAPLAQACAVGDGVFWFQGNFCGPLINFGHINNLLVENVHILGGHGFTLTCNFCRDVTYRNVKIAPVGNRIATSCRDGFKIYCATGKLLMDGVQNEGCLGDDGQNLHGIWLAVTEKRSDRALVATNSVWPSPCLTPGQAVVFLDDAFHPAYRTTVAACTSLGRDILITFSDPLPEWVHEKTALEPQEWLPDSLHIVNSVYRSTGRFGVLLKASNTLIENCLFENNVAGIHIGGEWSWGYWLESTNSQHVEIRGCTFRDNTLDIRFGGQKMDVAISVASWTAATARGLMGDIRIHDNLFEDEVLCASLQNCRDVWFWNNTLKNCGKDLIAKLETTENIYRTAPQPAA